MIPSPASLSATGFAIMTYTLLNMCVPVAQIQSSFQ
jgi:hypothetical protein